MARTYIETSIISYLTARPTSNLIAAAWQKTTIDWWSNRRRCFSLFISELVLEEAGKGNPDAAKARLSALAGIEILRFDKQSADLAKAIVSEGGMPEKSLDDALHVALAAINGMDYLLTWNCRHIDNAETKPRIRAICQSHGFPCPEITTPIELMGDDEDG
jgi:predicted nucleic acid-binding protein